MMSLQALCSFLSAHPTQLINALALLLSIGGGWLLLDTRRREQRGAGALLADSDLEPSDPEDESEAELNNFFYHCGFACLTLALVMSLLSTRL
jgi:hypothetical protein